MLDVNWLFCKLVDSLWPSDTIWRLRSGSTLIQVMACCLTAPSHYLNQCWLIISKAQWHSYRRIAQEIPQSSSTKISLKFTDAKFHQDLPEVNELKYFIHAVTETILFDVNWLFCEPVNVLDACSHWNYNAGYGRGPILLSQAAPQVVTMTPFSATHNDKFDIMKTRFSLHK